MYIVHLFDNKCIFHEVFHCAPLIMASLVIVFVALIAIIGSPNKVESTKAQALDLSKILELIQQQRLNTGPSKPRNLQLQIVSSDTDSDFGDSLTESEESGDFDNERFARLRKGKIVDLLALGGKAKINNDRLKYSKIKKNYDEMTKKSDDAENKRLVREKIIDLLERDGKEKRYGKRPTNSMAKENYDQMRVKSDDSDKRLESDRIIDLIKTVVKETKSNRNDRITNRKGKPKYGQKSNYGNTQRNNNHVQKQILEKLLSQLSYDEESQNIPKKTLEPNRLTPTVTMDDVKQYYSKQNKNIEVSKNNKVTGLEDYSKIYIVLNPQVVQNSKNKNSLNNMISKVLSLSSLTSKREEGMPRRYKGFVVNDNLPIRRFKTIGDSDKMSDDENKLDPPKGEITAMPT